MVSYSVLKVDISRFWINIIIFDSQIAERIREVNKRTNSDVFQLIRIWFPSIVLHVSVDGLAEWLHWADEFDAIVRFNGKNVKCSWLDPSYRRHSIIRTHNTFFYYTSLSRSLKVWRTSPNQ